MSSKDKMRAHYLAMAQSYQAEADQMQALAAQGGTNGLSVEYCLQRAKDCRIEARNYSSYASQC